jgi:hypothetical protein
LESDRLVHRAIFYFFEFTRSDGPSGELLLSRTQFRGPKQAADSVGVDGDHAFVDRRFHSSFSLV